MHWTMGELYQGNHSKLILLIILVRSGHLIASPNTRLGSEKFLEKKEYEVDKENTKAGHSNIL